MVKDYFNSMEGAPFMCSPHQTSLEPSRPLKDQFFFFFAWEAWWGQSPYFFIAEEKRFPLSYQVSFLWGKKKRRARTYSDPLSPNFRGVE